MRYVYIVAFFSQRQCYCQFKKSSNLVYTQILKFFTGLTNWLTGKTDYLTPVCMCEQGNNSKWCLPSVVSPSSCTVLSFLLNTTTHGLNRCIFKRKASMTTISFSRVGLFSEVMVMQLLRQSLLPAGLGGCMSKAMLKPTSQSCWKLHTCLSLLLCQSPAHWAIQHSLSKYLIVILIKSKIESKIQSIVQSMVQSRVQVLYLPSQDGS